MVVHLLAILFYNNFLLDVPSGTFRVGGVEDPLALEGMELVNLQELPEEEEDVMEILPPEEEPDPELPPAPVPAAPAEGDPGEVADSLQVEGPPPAAERLRPQGKDLRLWAPPDPELNRLTEEEIMTLRLMSALESMADSAAMAEELARRARDWTYTDEEGRRWGFSPGKIHLGDVTLPNPFTFGVKGEDQQRIWEWDLIEQGAARGSVMESWKDRNEAIRERMNAKREPDTTGVRR